MWRFLSNRKPGVSNRDSLTTKYGLSMVLPGTTVGVGRSTGRYKYPKQPSIENDGIDRFLDTSQCLCLSIAAFDVRSSIFDLWPSELVDYRLLLY